MLRKQFRFRQTHLDELFRFLLFNWEPGLEARSGVQFFVEHLSMRFECWAVWLEMSGGTPTHEVYCHRDMGARGVDEAFLVQDLHSFFVCANYDDVRPERGSRRQRT